MMSGTDLSLYGVIRPFYRPREYAHRLARSLGCTTADSYAMMECLRSPNITWEQFVDAQVEIIPNVSQLDCAKLDYCLLTKLLIEAS